MGIAQNFKKQTLKYMYLTTVLLSDKWPGIPLPEIRDKMAVARAH